MKAQGQKRGPMEGNHILWEDNRLRFTLTPGMDPEEQMKELKRQRHEQLSKLKETNE